MSEAQFCRTTQNDLYCTPNRVNEYNVFLSIVTSRARLFCPVTQLPRPHHLMSGGHPAGQNRRDTKYSEHLIGLRGIQEILATSLVTNWSSPFFAML